jgi:hypothetical protein
VLLLGLLKVKSQAHRFHNGDNELMKRAKEILELCESTIGLGSSGKPKAEIARTKPYTHKSDPNRNNVWLSDSIMLEKEDNVSRRALQQLEMQVRNLFERKKASPLCNVSLHNIDYTQDLSTVIDMIYDKYLDWDLSR